MGAASAYFLLQRDEYPPLNLNCRWKLQSAGTGRLRAAVALGTLFPFLAIPFSSWRQFAGGFQSGEWRVRRYRRRFALERR
jgi:hypothetical protein